MQTNRDGNRVLENGRLVYYHKAANEAYWENVWFKDINPDYYKPYLEGNLNYFDKMFEHHLPKVGSILEAGCGTAQLVTALRANNYNCFGLDYAFKAMQKANQIVGGLRLVCGDITALGIASDAFDAMVSIGVVEHRRTGPDVFLQEMRRILKPGGMLLISVPYFNDLRRWRAKRGAYQDDVTGLEFYQYAFTREEFCRILEANGYEIEAIYSYAHQNTLSQELHWLKKIPVFFNKLIVRISKYIPYVNSDWGHMLMVAARKKA
jgi:SAM-dependent methyltransferase